MCRKWETGHSGTQSLGFVYKMGDWCCEVPKFSFCVGNGRLFTRQLGEPKSRVSL